MEFGGLRSVQLKLIKYFFGYEKLQTIQLHLDMLHSRQRDKEKTLSSYVVYLVGKNHKPNNVWYGTQIA